MVAKPSSTLAAHIPTLLAHAQELEEDAQRAEGRGSWEVTAIPPPPAAAGHPEVLSCGATFLGPSPVPTGPSPGIRGMVISAPDTIERSDLIVSWDGGNGPAEQAHGMWPPLCQDARVQGELQAGNPGKAAEGGHCSEGTLPPHMLRQFSLPSEPMWHYPQEQMHGSMGCGAIRAATADSPGGPDMHMHGPLSLQLGEAQQVQDWEHHGHSKGTRRLAERLASRGLNSRARAW